MIIEAKYTGPFPAVTVPGFPRKTAKRGEVVKLKVRDGFPIGGDWEIIKGKDGYESALKKARKDRLEKAEARRKAQVIELNKINAAKDKQYDDFLKTDEVENAGVLDTKKAQKANKPEVKE